MQSSIVWMRRIKGSFDDEFEVFDGQIQAEVGFFEKLHHKWEDSLQKPAHLVVGNSNREKETNAHHILFFFGRIVAVCREAQVEVSSLSAARKLNGNNCCHWRFLRLPPLSPHQSAFFSLSPLPFQPLKSDPFVCLFVCGSRRVDFVFAPWNSRILLPSDDDFATIVWERLPPPDKHPLY